MVTCLTHGDGIGGRGGCESEARGAQWSKIPRRGEGRVEDIEPRYVVVTYITHGGKGGWGGELDVAGGRSVKQDVSFNRYLCVDTLQGAVFVIFSVFL